MERTCWSGLLVLSACFLLYPISLRPNLAFRPQGLRLENAQLPVALDWKLSVITRWQGKRNSPCLSGLGWWPHWQDSDITVGNPGIAGQWYHSQCTLLFCGTPVSPARSSLFFEIFCYEYGFWLDAAAHMEGVGFWVLRMLQRWKMVVGDEGHMCVALTTRTSNPLFPPDWETQHPPPPQRWLSWPSSSTCPSFSIVEHLKILEFLEGHFRLELNLFKK